MAELIIDLSGKKGLDKRYFGDYPYASTNSIVPTLRFGTSGTEMTYAKGVANPIAKLGYLSPAAGTFTAVSDAIPQQLMGASHLDTLNSWIYFTDRAERIYRIDSLNGTTLVVKQNVTGATMTDLEIYMVNGVRKLFYSYRKAGGGNIGMNGFDAAFDDDWLSTVPTGALNTGATNEVKMRVADNGYMYILDGSAVHKLDGTTAGGAGGTITANALLFPPFFQITDAVDMRGTLWISLIGSTRELYNTTTTGAFSEQYTGVYVWDRQSTAVNMKDFIPIDGIREIRTIHQFRGVPWAFTISSRRYTELRAYTGSGFEVKVQLAQNAYPKFHDSVANAGDMLVWAGVDGYMYAYGKAAPGEEDALYIIGDLTGSGTGSGTFDQAGAIACSGALETGDTITSECYYVTVSKTSSTAYFMRKWFPHSYTAENINRYPDAGNVYSLVYPLPRGSTVTSLTLFYPPSTTSDTTDVLDVRLYFNQSTTAWGPVTLKRSDGFKGYYFMSVGKKNVNFIQFKFTWKTDNVLSESINPSYAKVIYEPTQRKK